MKTKSFLSILILILITSSFSVLAQNKNFAGEWTINKEKTTLADEQLFLSGIKVELRNDSLLTTRTYENGMGESYPFDENLSLDGKESKISIYDMPRTSKATKSDAEGSLLVESTTIFNGQYGEDSLLAKETWKLDLEGKVLTIAFTNKMSGNDVTGTNIYDKVK
jgi:hypothetical protein